MVHTSTYILVMLTFFIGLLLFQSYFKKHAPMYGYIQVIGICILIEFALLSIVVVFPDTFQVLIYGSVLMGTYVCTYYRYRQHRKGELL